MHLEIDRIERGTRTLIRQIGGADPVHLWQVDGGQVYRYVKDGDTLSNPVAVSDFGEAP